MSNNRHNARRDANEPEIVDYLEGKGAIVYRVNSKDICDLIVFYQGETWFIEVKTADGVLSKGQKEFLKLLDENNANGTVSRTIDDINDLFGIEG